VFLDEAGAVIYDVTAGGPGLVAVGLGWSGETSNAAVWTSSDGITWSRVPHDEAIFGGEGFQTMQSVTVGGPGLVAVGKDGPAGDQDAAVWTSSDGITWSRVPHDEEVFAGQAMQSVTVGGPGLVAVGSDGLGAAVWTSSDGNTWSQVADGEVLFGGVGGLLSSVTAGGPGLVAVGQVWSGGAFDAAVWVAATGR
jgi:hypothetical protein